MAYKNQTIEKVAVELKAKLESLDGEHKRQILRDDALKSLFDQIKGLPASERGAFGAEVNQLRQELSEIVSQSEAADNELPPLDITAPWDVNGREPEFLGSVQGSVHPIMQEIKMMSDIYERMGFVVEEPRELDDDYHMFTSLNFPEGHPARDDFDTFLTDEGLVAPAHTSAMQNRVLKKYASNLDEGEPIAVVIPGRVFRNEDLDATHEHTFYQLEGVYVDKGINVGNLIATLKVFMNEYFGEEVKSKIQPFYFPFTEPSFELSIERPEVLKKDNTEDQKWLELLGCGLIHPNVLREANIDPDEYTGFAWGGGMERLIMLKHKIEDIRHFESGKLEFLRQF